MKSVRLQSGSQRYQAFLRDAICADEVMRRSGRGYRADDVYACLEAKVVERRVRRPRRIRWRG